MIRLSIYNRVSQNDVKEVSIVAKEETVLPPQNNKSVPEWMKWDKKNGEEQKETEVEEDDGGIIELEPKLQVRHGRRQTH